LSGRGKWARDREREIEVLPGDTIVVPLNVNRANPLTLWTDVTQVIYNQAIAVTAINSF